MLNKLYIAKYKENIPSDTKFKEFEKFYKENNVTVVGGWQNTDDKTELYFMTSYRDQNHYDDFISKMKDNNRYQELSAELENDRVSVKAVNLKNVGDITPS